MKIKLGMGYENFETVCNGIDYIQCQIESCIYELNSEKCEQEKDIEFVECLKDEIKQLINIKELLDRIYHLYCNEVNESDLWERCRLDDQGKLERIGKDIFTDSEVQALKKITKEIANS